MDNELFELAGGIFEMIRAAVQVTEDVDLLAKCLPRPLRSAKSCLGTRRAPTSASGASQSIQSIRGDRI